jgi:Iodothyronine deiodinase
MRVRGFLMRGVKGNMARYNYKNFSSKDYDFDRSNGPKAGEKAPDFQLTTIGGAPHALLDFDGEFLVLELGSITCPLFQSRRKIMGGIAAVFPGVSSAVLYVREAHPGVLIPRHTDAAAKQACAARLVQQEGEARLVLVDDIQGQAHQAYGGMPNAVFIINRKGCVVFRADWNNPQATRRALQTLLQGRAAAVKSYFLPASPALALRTLRQAGKGSAADFFKSLPALIWANLIKRNLRLLFNRPVPVLPDSAC